jgi:multidrug efflux pump
MTLGTIFTLFVVPVFYSLIAAQHQPSPVDEEIGEDAPAGREWQPEEALVGS